MGIIITICNNKGGVGKTTTAVNLGHALGLRKKKVLVCDFDSQCNTSRLLSQKGEPFQMTLHDMLSDDSFDPKNFRQLIHTTDCRNVYLMPNHIGFDLIEADCMTGTRNPEDIKLKFRNQLRQPLIDNFDFIILDTPPNLGLFVYTALHASDFCLIPVRAGSQFSTQGLLAALEKIAEFSQKPNANLKLLKILINGRNRRTSISKVIIENVYEYCSAKNIFKTIIPQNTDFEKAELYANSIFQYNNNAPGAQAFRNLAQEVLTLLGDPDAKKRPKNKKAKA